LLVTPADNQDRAQVSELAEAPCRRQPASRWRWRMWIRAIQESSKRGCRARYQPRGGQASRGQGRVCASGAQMGNRARFFCVGKAVSEVGQGLRASTRNRSGVALCRFCLPLPPPGDLYHWSKSITRSSGTRAPEPVSTAFRAPSSSRSWSSA
jgi:hypothetical protein